MTPETLSRLAVVTGDITQLDADGIVNAANSSLLGGSGVDGAIHRAAGPELVAECARLNGCKPGEAKLTKGYRLKARHVIHTVGPIWHGGHAREDETLASCYRNALQLAADRKLATLAFPAISTGVYGYPPAAAATVAVTAIARFLGTSAWPRQVILCAHDEASAETLKGAIAAHA